MFGSSNMVTLTPTQQVFSLSKANGATDYGVSLPVQRWEWPKGTWLQKRRALTILKAQKVEWANKQ